MKQLYIILISLLLLASSQAKAQNFLSEFPTDTLRQKLTSIFANIDKSQVPTGYLYEAGVRFMEPRFYNGVLSDSNRTDMNVLRYMRAQLLSSLVYGVDTLPSLPEFNTRLEAAVAQAAAGAIPVAVYRQPYASIRPEALQNNWLRAQNEQLFDVANRAQNPYRTNVLFLAAPDLTYSRGNTVSFLFRKNLFLANFSSPLSSADLFLDFDDGRGYQPITWGQPLGTTYATAGNKRIKVKLVARPTISIVPFVEESWFDFEVQTITPAARYSEQNGFSRRISPGNQQPGALVSVRYGRGHGPHVVKPFIIVEQYNIAQAAPHLVKCNNANNTVGQFLDRIGSPDTDPYDFNDKLEAAGYDLIYVDFDRNTDDITRNARVVEQVIQEVNAWKSTSHYTHGLAVEQNVVMGMSMGGLISRYALAEMTKNTFPYGPPDTRLLILHDSPQRGAYNPVGLQSFTRTTDQPFTVLPIKLLDLDDRLKDAVNVLNEPASQQLSILNAFNGRGDIRPNTFIDGVYADMTDFSRPTNASGPQPAYQIIATSDGSQCGRGSGAPLGVQLSFVTTYSSGVSKLLSILNPVPYLGNFSLGASGAAYGLPAYGQQATISRMRIYIQYDLRIGTRYFGIVIPIRANLLNENALSPPNTLPYETLPGGTTNLDRESGGCGATTGIASLFLRTGLYNGDICFVPTYSALDVPSVTPATAFATYVAGITNNVNQPRVARFIANETTYGNLYNRTHIQFTPRNSEWLFREMQNNNPELVLCQSLNGCSPADNIQITGPTTVCGSSTYSLPLNGNGLTYAWTASPANLFTISSGSGPTFTTSNVGDGTGTISVTVTGGCSFTFQRPVSVGAPAEFYITGPAEINECDQAGEFYVLPYDPNLRYTVTSSGSVQAKPIFTGGGLQLIPRRVGMGYVTVTAQNNCGSTTQNLSVMVTSCYYYQYSVYPNPAQQEVTISVQPVASRSVAAKAVAPPAPDFDVTLYNGQGQAVRQGRSKDGQLRLNLRGLRTGFYQLRTGQGSKWENHQLQIIE